MEIQDVQQRQLSSWSTKATNARAHSTLIPPIALTAQEALLSPGSSHFSLWVSQKPAEGPGRIVSLADTMWVRVLIIDSPRLCIHSLTFSFFLPL